jgi:hypothetical protein
LIDQKNVDRDQAPQVDMPLDQFTQDMRNDIDRSISLQPSFQTLQHRVQIVCKVYELGKSLNQLCQSFYDDQYWQYQGFLALIANLDDYVISFRKKEEVIREHFDKYLNDQMYYKNLMNNIENYIDVLSKIRLLPQLISQYEKLKKDSSIGISQSSSNIHASSTTKQQLPQQQQQQQPSNSQQNQKKLSNNSLTLFSGFSSQSIVNLQSPSSPQSPLHSDIIQQQQQNQLQSPTGGQLMSVINENNEVSNSSVYNKSENDYTLLDFVNQADPHNELTSVIQKIREIQSRFDINMKWPELKKKIDNIFYQMDNNPQMREIDGLTKRLNDLNGLIDTSKKFLSAQNETVESFKANLQRATSLRDESILNDLCKAHKTSLEVFKSNHSHLIEIVNKVSKAKLELIRVIHSRLNWVMVIQKKMHDCDIQLEFFYKELGRLNTRLHLMEQLKRAPKVYLYSLVETLRRNHFSSIYKTFVKQVITLLTNVHSNEIQRRLKFDAKIESKHFVQNFLFRGLNDTVSGLPLVSDLLSFDQNLPELDKVEVNEIEQQILSHITFSANSRSIISSKSDETDSNQINNDNTLNSACTVGSLSPHQSTTTTTTTKPINIEPKSDEVALNSSTMSSSSSSKLAKDSSILLSELKFDENTEFKNDTNLQILTKLNNTLIEMLEEGSSPSTTTTTTTTITNDLNLKSQLLKTNLVQLRNDFEAIHSVLNQFGDDFKQKINSIKETNTKLGDFTSNQVEFYSKLKPSIESILQQQQPAMSSEELERRIDNALKQFNDPNECPNSDNHSFALWLINSVSSVQRNNNMKLQSLNNQLVNIKTNINAEKQVQFNEAIKRSTMDKDRIIDELKTREIAHLEQIEQLKEEISRLKDKKSQQKDITTSNDALNVTTSTTDINPEVSRNYHFLLN